MDSFSKEFFIRGPVNDGDKVLIGVTDANPSPSPAFGFFGAADVPCSSGPLQNIVPIIAGLQPNSRPLYESILPKITFTIRRISAENTLPIQVQLQSDTSSGDSSYLTTKQTTIAGQSVTYATLGSEPTTFTLDLISAIQPWINALAVTFTTYNLKDGNEVVVLANTCFPTASPFGSSKIFFIPAQWYFACGTTFILQNTDSVDALCIANCAVGGPASTSGLQCDTDGITLEGVCDIVDAVGFTDAFDCRQPSPYTYCPAGNICTTGTCKTTCSSTSQTCQVDRNTGRYMCLIEAPSSPPSNGEGRTTSNRSQTSLALFALGTISILIVLSLVIYFALR
jgi:hypothetical protein